MANTERGAASQCRGAKPPHLRAWPDETASQTPEPRYLTPLPAISFTGLLVVSAVAFASPLILGLVPKVRLPTVVLEIVLGILIGPSVLGLVDTDLPIRVLSLVGLAFLLFLAGLEVELERLRGRLLALAGSGFLLSLGLALPIGFGLRAWGEVRSPLLVSIILATTSLGLVAAVLKDAGQSASDFGQLVIAGATIGEFGAVVLLSLFFSGEATAVGAKLILLGSFGAAIVGVAATLTKLGRIRALSNVFVRLQDTTAQIRVRGAVVLLIGFVVLAERFGLETILGAFMAGVVLRAADRDAATHPHFRLKLEGIGFGFLIPVFFVASGVQLELNSLFSSASTIVLVPIFLVALLLVRGLPALLYRGVVSGKRTVAAGLLQATSLPFIVAATQIGLELGDIRQATGAALVAAGLLSVIAFPPTALFLVEKRGREAS